MFLTLLIKATKSSLSGLQLASHWVWQGNRCGSWHAPWQVQWWWTHRCGLDVMGGRQHWMATLLVEVGSEWGVSEGVIRSWVHSWDCSSMSRFSFYKHKNTGIKQRCSALYSVHCTAEGCWLVTFMHESVLPRETKVLQFFVNLWHFCTKPYILTHKPYLMFSLWVDWIPF